VYGCCVQTAASAGSPSAPPRNRSDRPPRAPGRPRAGESVDEAAFLEAALEAFARRGYDAVSARELSKELGVSHGWVHQRFGSKQGLWYAAVDHGFGRQAAVVTVDPTITHPIEQFEHVIREWLRYSARHPELALLMNAEGTQDTDRLDYIYENYIAPPLAPFELLLEHLIETGVVRPVPMRTVFLLLGHGATALFGLVPLARRLDRADPTSPKYVDEHIEAVTRIIVDGIRTERP
jgi:TetR/AcrR family transcriptional regulator